jgi:hypothetical protein
VSNKPGRHETSMGGLIGAMIVLVTAILAFVAFRELTREVPEIKPTAVVGWQEAAESTLRDGHAIAVPEVPSDWIVTTLRFEPTLKPTWDLGMFTADEKFAGVYQVDERVDTVVEERVDEKAVEGEPVEIPTGDLAGEWMTFTDEGGDYALVREDENGVVMVYGSADEEEIRALAGTIRTAP